MLLALDGIVGSPRQKEYMNLLLSKMADKSGLKDSYMIIDKNTNDIYGVIEYTVSKSKESVFIEHICVFEEYREKGIARKIIELLNKDYSIIGNSTLEALGFWKNIGAEFDEDIEDEENLIYYIENHLCVPFTIY